MDEAVFRAKHDVLRIRLQSAWKEVDEASTVEARQELFKRADWLQAEIIALEELQAKPDTQRELQWWEAQYSSKLRDIREGSEDRPVPTPEELRYFEDKIVGLGGQVSRVQELSWIDYHDQLIKEWFDGERALIDDLYPSRPVTVKNPHLHRDVFIRTIGIIVACFVIAQFLIWLFGL